MEPCNVDGCVADECAIDGCTSDGCIVERCVLEVSLVSTPVDEDIGPDPGELGPPAYIHSGGLLLVSSFSFLAFSPWRRRRRRR
jgi:hypothetical protein